MTRAAHKVELDPYPLGLSQEARARFDRLIRGPLPGSKSGSSGTSHPNPAPDYGTAPTAPSALSEPTTDELRAAYRQALTEELHVETVLGRSLLTQALDDQARVRKYTVMIDHLLERDPIRHVETIRKLELMIETAHRGWLRALEAIRLHRAPSSPVVVQAAAAAGGHVHVSVSAPRSGHRRKPGQGH